MLTQAENEAPIRYSASRAIAPSFALALALTMTVPAFGAAPALLSGDRSATVTVDGRPLSADTDHIVAFDRGKTLYVCVEDLKQMVSGSMTRAGKQLTVKSFKGDSNSRTFVFTVGSMKATAHGQAVELSAPVLDVYGHIYIPLSFFGSNALRTHAKISADGRAGDILLPPGME